MIGVRASAVCAVLLAAVSAGCIRVKLPEARVIRGETETALSWERAGELALARNPDILQARSEVNAAVRAKQIAMGEYLPEADGEFVRGRQKRSHADAKTTGTSWKDDMGIGVSARQEIFTGFRRTGNFLRAKMELGAAQFGYQETSADVRFRLRQSYVELLSLNKELEVNRRIAERRHENAEMIRLRYEAGRENVGSLMRADALAENADFDIRKTERKIESQSWNLSREMGGPFMLRLRAEGDLEDMVPDPPPAGLSYPELAENAPTVRRLVKTAEAFNAAIIVAQSEVWPKVGGNFTYGYSGEGPTNLDDDSLRVGLRVDMPFFRGGRSIEGIALAKANYEAALEDARSARDQRVADLAAAWTDFRDAGEFVPVRSAFQEASRERAQIVRAKYATGLVDFQEFDIAEQELADSERAYVLSLAADLLREADWEVLKGATLEDLINAE